MQWICAWCNADITPKTDPAPEQKLISHGICPGCARSLLASQGVALQEFLDGLAAPVVLVDASVRITALNQAARIALETSHERAQHQSFGQVFDCSHARVPGGCGKLFHCSGCAIRTAVETTHVTGNPQSNVPATLVRGSDSAADASLLVSTFKSGGVVALRVEGLAPLAAD